MPKSYRKPAEARSDRLGDFLDQPVLIRPREYKEIDTTQGQSMALMADALIPNPDAGSGAYWNLGVVPIFWKGVQSQLDGAIGEWHLGRLHHGTDRNPKAYVLQDPTPEDEVLAEAIMATFDGDDAF